MEFFDPETEGMVNAREMVKLFTESRGVREEDLSLPSRAIITFSRRMFNGLVQLTGANRFGPWRGRNPSLFLTSATQHPLALTMSPYGAPGAVMLLEELIAFGVDRVAFTGYCGSIQDGVELGGVVLPTRAVREEGTSYHYLPRGAASRPDRMLLHSLHQWLQRRGLPARRGAIWTTDALYRETRKKIERYRTEGVLAVDMETAALFAVGAVRRVSVVGLLLVSDQFSQGAWTPGFFHPVLLERERLMNGMLLEWVGGLV
jgi:purine-nucleoside phosphorylase